MDEQVTFFDARFLESFAGDKILNNPVIAVVELIANSWDAGATKVDIEWPNKEKKKLFSISDNGCGMNLEEFDKRWMTLAYNRKIEQGTFAEFPAGGVNEKRKAFGKNGKGRLSGFCFSSEYFVETIKDGKKSLLKVFQGSDLPLKRQILKESPNKKQHGTKVFVKKLNKRNFISTDEIRKEIGMRFLLNPNFEVFVDNEKVTFSDIPGENIKNIYVDIPNIGKIEILVIDTVSNNKTINLRGVAWHVNNRLVGEYSWRLGGSEPLVDGRSNFAKRYNFIVNADCISEYILPDWSGFSAKDNVFQAVAGKVRKEILKYLIDYTKDEREGIFNEIKQINSSRILKMGLYGAEKWEKSVKEIQIQCRSIKQNDLFQIAELLAKLELSSSKYQLIFKLNELKPLQLDELNTLLSDWSLDAAKIVLDELKWRMRLLEELERKVLKEDTDEVHELQPLFKRGLWIFGPEYETIEFTSNQSMNTVISRLFKKKEIQGSQNRPDFAISPDSTVGCYYYPSYDIQGGEIGVQKLVIVELKKPSVPITGKEKDQCWKYVKELMKKGLIAQDQAEVTCFLLGSRINPFDRQPREEGNTRIIPLDYSIIIERAKSRLLKLYDRVREAPFLNKADLDDFADRIDNLTGGNEPLEF